MREGAGAGGFHGSDPFDLFNMFFRGGEGGPFGGGQREARGKNVVHQLTVSLEELYNGAVRKLALQKTVICSKCEGRFSKYVFQWYPKRNIELKFRSWWKRRCSNEMYNM